MFYGSKFKYVQKEAHTASSNTATMCIAPWNFLNKRKKWKTLVRLLLCHWSSPALYSLGSLKRIFCNKLLYDRNLEDKGVISIHTWTWCTLYKPHHASPGHPRLLWSSTGPAKRLSSEIHGWISHRTQWDSWAARAPVQKEQKFKLNAVFLFGSCR